MAGDTVKALLVWGPGSGRIARCLMEVCGEPRSVAYGWRHAARGAANMDVDRRLHILFMSELGWPWKSLRTGSRFKVIDC